MKSIKTKIVVLFAPLFLVTFLGLTALLYRVAATSIETEAMNSIANVAYQGSKIVKSRLDAELASLETLAAMPQIYDSSIPMEEKIAVLKKRG